ncbi:MAG: hypothetical protein CRN43_11440 [Candidatus Nephrothrix sp. EaCA]|nr:MAG: hypothetical protein CRN43_11440 [Candidatus Nephrothrix sp. EaCA]
MQARTLYSQALTFYLINHYLADACFLLAGQSFLHGGISYFFGPFAFKLKIRYFLPLRFSPLFGNDGH